MDNHKHQKKRFHNFLLSSVEQHSSVAESADRVPLPPTTPKIKPQPKMKNKVEKRTRLDQSCALPQIVSGSICLLLLRDTLPFLSQPVLNGWAEQEDTKNTQSGERIGVDGDAGYYHRCWRFHVQLHLLQPTLKSAAGVCFFFNSKSNKLLCIHFFLRFCPPSLISTFSRDEQNGLEDTILLCSAMQKQNKQPKTKRQNNLTYISVKKKNLQSENIHPYILCTVKYPLCKFCCFLCVWVTLRVTTRKRERETARWHLVGSSKHFVFLNQQLLAQSLGDVHMHPGPPWMDRSSHSGSGVAKRSDDETTTGNCSLLFAETMRLIWFRHRGFESLFGLNWPYLQPLGFPYSLLDEKRVSLVLNCAKNAGFGANRFRTVSPTSAVNSGSVRLAPRGSVTRLWPQTPP